MRCIIAQGVSWSTPTAHTVINNVSISLGNEKTGLAGLNGSGKTTFVRLLLGELPPTAGTVERFCRLGYLPQSFELNPDASVADLLGIAVPGAGDDLETDRAALKQAHLSGGRDLVLDTQHQLVALRIQQSAQGPERRTRQSDALRRHRIIAGRPADHESAIRRTTSRPAHPAFLGQDHRWGA